MNVPERLSEGYQGLWFLSAMRTAYDRGLLTALREASPQRERALAELTGLGPDVLRGLLDLLIATGVLSATADGDVELTAQGRNLLGPMEAMIFADLESTLGQHGELWRRTRDRADRLQGWEATDLEIVEAQARFSAAATKILQPVLDAGLPGFAARVQRGDAVLLDLGAGGGGATVAFARYHPTLRVVGIEPSPVALARARARIADSGLADRIELVAGTADDLDDQDRFAAIYVAQMFFPEDAWRRALPRMLRALEPGGSVFTVATYREGADPSAALSRWKTALWGGGRRSADRLLADFGEAGYTNVKGLPFPGPLQPVFAQKA